MKRISFLLFTLVLLIGCYQVPQSGYHPYSGKKPKVAKPKKPKLSKNSKVWTCSYYGKKFHGRKTANGETFNMYKVSCAHKSLPFNTLLKVTNVKNGKSIQVRVNDRGPYVDGRDLDLSFAAMKKLGGIKDGVIKAEVKIVKEGK